MNKRLFKTILFLMSLSLVGLLLLQAFWVSRTLEANERHLKHNTYQAINEVVDQLKKCVSNRSQKDLSVYMSKKNQRKRKPKKKIKTRMDYTYKRGDGTVVTIYDVNNVTSKDYSPGANKVYPDRMINRAIELQKAIDDNEMLETAHQNLETAHQNMELMEHSAQALEMAFCASQLMVVLPFQNIRPSRRSLLRQYVDIKLLEAYTEEALSKRGIETEYKVGILDTYRSKVFIPKEKQEEYTAMYQGYTVPIYNNNSRYQLSIYYPRQDQYVWQKTSLVLVSSTILVGVIIACFYLSLKMIRRQKKVSDIKNDFINNVTHELKTPIATISLATEALMDDDIRSIQGFQDRYINVIKSENQRLQKQVEKILQIATLESTNFEVKIEPVDLNELVKDVVTHFQVPIESREGKITLELTDQATTINVDPFHLTNVIYNLIDNANKYSDSSPEITIKTSRSDGRILLSVKDQGKGISKEHQKHVFEKFYRVPTGNRHDVKGFGLGLSYVKKIIDYHHGTVQIKSDIGKGTEFVIALPLETQAKY